MPHTKPPTESNKSIEEACTALKARFRECDLNRDGMLDKQELGRLLRMGRPEFTDREVTWLFLSVDKDCSGKIDFDEFVDFLFHRPVAHQLPQDIREPVLKPEVVEEVTALRVASKQIVKHDVIRVVLGGATLDGEVNGIYKRNYHMFASNHPVYEHESSKIYMLFGWTEGRQRHGWFVADELPQFDYDGPTRSFRLFNPSEEASTPNECRACWETPGGNREKRIFCIEDEDQTQLDKDAAETFDCIGAELCEVPEHEHQTRQREIIAMHSAPTDTWDEDMGEDIEEFEGDTNYIEDFQWAHDEDDASSESDGECADLEEDFVDPYFSPSEATLGYPMGFDDPENMPEESAFVADRWMRIKELNQKPCLWHKILPNDVFYAESAASWPFMTAVAAVAEFPAWIQSLFGLSTRIRRHGRYTVRLFHPSFKQFVRVSIDDFVPTKFGSPSFVGLSADGAVWPALVEKAFAKFVGSYKNTASGTVLWGMQYLCGGDGAERWTRKEGAWRCATLRWQGASSKMLIARRNEALLEQPERLRNSDFWNMLLGYVKSCYPITCSIASEAEADEEDSGLLADQSYNLIAAQELDVNGKVLRMVFLRNPFGVRSWAGRWGNQSETWAKNPAVQHALRFKPHQDDGTFWMSFYDFCSHFHVVDIAKKSLPVQGSHVAKLRCLDLAVHPDEFDDLDDLLSVASKGK
mmetsp:Transcript_43052/g.99034  ORF Transcript_43052/g.99034 Transcript_43052/m.99034 type:complete len:695 (-) Transcript_43052:99-2183(-)